MTTYYKATRPTDPATDFYTGRVIYEIGITGAASWASSNRVLDALKVPAS